MKVKFFCLICTWLAAAGTLLQASELRADLTGSLQNTGNIKLSAVGNKAFYNNSGFIISNTSRLELKTAPVLNSNAGTIRLKLRSLDWSGNDSSSKYFFYARKRGGKDVIFLRKDANGDLVFAMGKLPHDLDTAGVSAAFWKKNAVHTLEAVWDNDVIELYVDNIKVASRQRTVKSLAWSDPAWIGGNVWSPSAGQSAVEQIVISDQTDRKNATGKTQKSRIISLEIPDNITFKPLKDNICTEEYQAVILPGSQHKPDRSKAVEMLYDQQTATWYRSDKATQKSDRFLEIYWPSAVKVRGVKLLPHPALAPKSYQVSYRNRNGRWVKLARQDQAGEYTAFDEVFTEQLRLDFTLAEDADEFGLLELEVAGSGPRKFLKERRWSGRYLWPLPDENGNTPTVAVYRRTFRINDPAQLTKAFFQLSADDAWDLYLNGKKISTGGFAVTCFDFKDQLLPGENTIVVRAENYGGPAGFLSELQLFYRNGAMEILPSDSSWQYSTTLNGNYFMPNDQQNVWQASSVSPSLKDYAAKVRFNSGIDNQTAGAFTARAENLPAELRPGDRLRFKLHLTAGRKISGQYGFRIILGEKALLDYCDFTLISSDIMPEKPTSLWQTGQSEVIEVDLFIPQWAPHGDQPLRIRALSDDGELPVNLAGDPQIKIRRFEQDPPPKTRPVQSRIIRLGNQTRVQFGNEILPPVILGLNGHYTTYRMLGSVGKLQPGLLRYKPGVWKLYSNDGNDDRYFAELLPGIDQAMRQTIRFFPDAKIIVPLDCRINYSRSKPDQSIIMSDGQKLMFSFSSQEWRDLMKKNGSRLIRHMLNSDYAGNIAGFVLVLGAGGETMHYGYAANRGNVRREELVFGDFSPAAQAKFREFLRKRYNNDVNQLRAAWRRSDVTFENAAADPDELRKLEDECFRNPANSTMSMDYWEFHSDAVADACNELAEAFKKASGYKALIADWGFYSFAVYPHNTASTRGGLHQIGGMSLDKVLACPYVDIVAAIQGYGGVRENTLLHTAMPAASLRENNKLFVEEFDVRTYFVDFNKIADHHTVRASETCNVMKRDFGELLVRGDSGWFCGFDGYTGRESMHWFGTEELYTLINRMNQIGRVLNKSAISGAAEVAVFVNNRDIAALDMLTAADLFHNTQTVSAYGKYKGRPAYGFKNTAIPYDLYLLHDFDKAMQKPYKLLVMLNAFYLSSADRKHIQNTLAKSGKTVLWLYAPGFVDRQHGSNVEFVSELTGFKLTCEHRFLRDPALNVTADNWTAHQVAAEKNAYAPTDLLLGPVFRIDDPEATVIGRYTHDRTPALGVKKVQNMTSIFCAVPRLTPELFRDAARLAGVHIYSNAAVSLNANKHVISIHAPLGMDDVITLPASATVLDLFTGEITARNTTCVPLKLAPGSNVLWYIGSDSEVQHIQQELKKGK